MRSLLCCLALVLVFVATGRAQPMPTRDCIKTGDNCRENCVSPQRYQWCGDCTHYLDCTTGFPNYPLCPSGLVWNDAAKLCTATSSTCTQCVEPAPKCTGTGPTCLNDCLGQRDGVYQWCGRCDYFLQCTGGATAITKCQQDTLFYDDNFKACIAVSSTCTQCSINPSPCASDPCYNGGTCHDNGDGSYWCECPPGYYGQRCEGNVCVPNPCANGGTCVVQGSGHTCICAPGWTGTNCVNPIGPCTPSPCMNGGTCVDNGDGSSSCDCTTQWTGSLCESPNFQETCGSLLAWTQYPPQHGFSIFCVLDATAVGNRYTPCTDTILNIPIWGTGQGIINAGGNFGCIVSNSYPNDLDGTSYMSCQNNYQQNVFIGDAVANHLMVCIHFPYEGINATAGAHGKV